MNKRPKLKNERGITLLALVVTVIVLIILASVSLNLILGNNGIINKAKDAAKVYAEKAEEEDAFLKDLEDYVDTLGESSMGVKDDDLYPELKTMKLTCLIDAENTYYDLPIVKYSYDNEESFYYNFTVDWGDGSPKETYSSETTQLSNTQNQTVDMLVNTNYSIDLALRSTSNEYAARHIYSTTGTYNIEIDGEFDYWSNKDDDICITTAINQFGVTNTKMYEIGKKIEKIASPSKNTFKNSKVSIICNDEDSKINELPANMFVGAKEILVQSSLIKEIVIPNSVTNATLQCLNLKNIEVESENSVFSSVDGVLYNKDKTELIMYPYGREDTYYKVLDGVLKIRQMAFVYSKLNEIKLPDTLTEIGDYAFGACENITSIVIPEKVSTIGVGILEECVNIKNIEVESENSVFSSVDGVLYNKDKTELIIYPCGREDTYYKVLDDVLKIKENAFRNSKLSEISLPDTLKEIEDYAFIACNNITSIVIPEKVSTIGFGAFGGCYNMKNIYCRVSSQPDGWEYDWNPHEIPITWGYTGE